MKAGKIRFSPEDYVAGLYRSMLGREPDSDGAQGYIDALRNGASAIWVLGEIQNSAEYRARQASFSRPGAEVETALLREHDTVDKEAADLDFIIKASEKYFNDIDFFKRLNSNAFPPRRACKIRTIAIYYWRMNDGGTERVTARQVQMWTAMGYRVILLTDQEADPLKDYPYGENIERFILPERMMFNNYYPPRGRALADVLEREDVDIFITNQWYELSTIWDVLVAKSLGIPTVIGWHNCFDAGIHSVDDLAIAYLRFLSYRHADAMVVLSHVDRVWFERWGVTARMIHNPLTFDRMSEEPAPLDGKTIVWVARAERHQKRIDLALKMFPLVLQQVPDARLMIVGGGPDLDWAREYAQSLNIRSQVHFVGYTKDVQRYIEKASVHVMTSEFEGYPMVLGEVWSHGVPTVIFDLPQIEYLRTGKGHIKVPQGDIVAMAEAVSGLMLDPARRRKLGREAREVVADIIADKLDTAWTRLFADIETGKSIAPPATSSDVDSMSILIDLLGHRLMSLHRLNFPEPRLPVLPSAVPVKPAQKKSLQVAEKAVRAAAAPFYLAKMAASARLVPERRLRTIDLSNIGLGDNLMIWAGLFALLDMDADICAPGCVIHVQPILGDLAERLFGGFGLEVRRSAPENPKSPVYSPLPPETWREWYNTYIGRDWRMNWVEALDRQKTFPRDGTDLSFEKRARLRISEYLLFRRNSWTQATPSYVGYRVWLPLALGHGIYPLQFMTQLKRSLGRMRMIFGSYVDNRTPENDRANFRRNVCFPAGKSFQTIPPQVLAAVNERLGSDRLECYVQNDSAWRGDFEKGDLDPRHIANLMDTFRLVRYADKLLTTDSFTSHLAQFLRDDFVLVLSRDMRENIVHPGANPTIVAEHPACAPCNYQERYHFDTCVAGYKYCLAFNNATFVDKIAAAVKG